jgi:hypothetical protein
MQVGDKVKHKNMFISGEVVKITDEDIAYVECEGGRYYDTLNNWEQIETEPDEVTAPETPSEVSIDKEE